MMPAESKSALALYRETAAQMHQAAQQYHSLLKLGERVKARKALEDFKSLSRQQQDMIETWRTSFSLYMEQHLPKDRAMDMALVALPWQARQAYRAEARFVVAEQDYHVHLLAWVDAWHAAQEECAAQEAAKLFPTKQLFPTKLDAEPVCGPMSELVTKERG